MEGNRLNRNSLPRDGKEMSLTTGKSEKSLFRVVSLLHGNGYDEGTGPKNINGSKMNQNHQLIGEQSRLSELPKDPRNPTTRRGRFF